MIKVSITGFPEQAHRVRELLADRYDLVYCVAAVSPGNPHHIELHLDLEESDGPSNAGLPGLRQEDVL